MNNGQKIKKTPFDDIVDNSRHNNINIMDSFQNPMMIRGEKNNNKDQNLNG